jgi:hypothetical protein
MIAANPTRARRTLALGLALLLGGLFASHASAVAVCQKTSKKGKNTFKLRDACLTDKGEVEVSVGTRTEVYRATTDAQQDVINDDTAIAIDGANTSFSFDTTAPSADVVINFTAGCHIVDASGGGWIDIEIRLDDAAVPPSDLARNGFCWNAGANDETEFTNSYTVAVEDLEPGTHSIQVITTNASLSPTAFLGDVSLVVTVHEN